MHALATNKIYEFSPIITDQETFKQHSYSFLATNEDVIFLYINNFGEGLNFGNVYSSGDQGKYFSLSFCFSVSFARRLYGSNIKRIERCPKPDFY